jgi:hypothetical protein
MDDLDVIRLVAVDNITKRRIARAKMEVKENLGGGRRRGRRRRRRSGKVAFHVCWLIVRRKLCSRKEDWSR